MKLFGFFVILAGMAGSVSAAVVVNAPEINASSSVTAISLVSGAILVFRSRRNKN